MRLRMLRGPCVNYQELPPGICANIWTMQILLLWRGNNTLFKKNRGFGRDRAQSHLWRTIWLAPDISIGKVVWYMCFTFGVAFLWRDIIRLRPIRYQVAPTQVPKYVSWSLPCSAILIILVTYCRKLVLYWPLPSSLTKTSENFLVYCSYQRVLNGLQRTRLSSGRTNPLLAPPPLMSKLSFFLSLPLCHRSSLVTEGLGIGEELNHTTSRNPGPL